MDYYKILDITRDSTDDEIKRAYKKLVLKYHPDKNKDEGAEDMFKKITTAYEVLSDKKRRRVYDLTGNVEEGIDLQSAFKTFMDNFNTNDMKDLFSDCINSNNIPNLFDNLKNSGIKFSIHTFSGIKAFDGVPLFNRGGYPFLRKGESYKIVNDSDSENYYEEWSDNGDHCDHGDHSDISSNCDDVSGEKKTITKGKNLYYDLYVSLEDLYRRKRKKVSVSRFRLKEDTGEYVKEKIKLHVPLYQEEVIFEGEADQGEDYDQAGDVVININYKPCNSCYLRNKCDLVYTKDISVSDLYTGGSCVIELLNGKKIKVSFNTDLLSMEEGMREVKIKGKGIPKSDKERGDLYVNFVVKFPQLNEKEVSIIKSLFPTLL